MIDFHLIQGKMKPQQNIRHKRVNGMIALSLGNNRFPVL